MNSTYPFVLEALPYDYGFLEPIIDRATMEIHHDKHHQTYLDNLNKLLAERPELQAQSLEQLMSSEVVGVKNNAGGVWNHNQYWQAMTAPDSSKMSEEISTKLTSAFGSVEEFRAIFEQAAFGRFGSGWAWLVKTDGGDLEIMSTPNQDNPLSEGKVPVFGIDVWEHSYYLKYQNRRAEYVKEWWRLINWDKVTL